MTRLVNRPIEVERWQEGEPGVFRDGEHVYEVSSILDRWAEMGDWWDGEGERKVLRVLTTEYGLYDLECMDNRWYIYKVWD